MNPFDPKLYADAAASEETRKLNATLISLLTPLPNWWDTGAEATREARRRGDGPFPLAPISPRAVMRTVDGPGGHKIPVRVIPAQSPRGVYLHIHGGGWVLGGADLHDPMLEQIADNTAWQWSASNTGWRRSTPIRRDRTIARPPALWLARNAKAEFGTDVLTIGGEFGGRASLGGDAAAHARPARLYRLPRRQPRLRRVRHGMTPSQRAFGNRAAGAAHERHRAVLQRVPAVECRIGATPTFRRCSRTCGTVPRAVHVGTRDALLDDSLFMHARWIAAGNAAEFEVYPGGAHGFTLFPCELNTEASAQMDAFLRRAVEPAV